MSDHDQISVVDNLRELPAVNKVLDHPAIAALHNSIGHNKMMQLVRQWLDEQRQAIQDSGQATLNFPQLARRIEQASRASLIPVLNGSGVVVHTNLGRAPLSQEALQSVIEISEGYSNLEYDLDKGQRGHRHDHCSTLLRDLTGAEAAVVVNNNAAAVLLILSALAKDKSVIVSRGELVEIGGSFRIPDVMRQSGAALVEVGSTNRTRLSDYQKAIDDATAMLLKVHQSNFAIVGFTEQSPLKELAKLAQRQNIPLVYDAGSGILQHSDILRDELSISEILSSGVDLVSFSGDKLLGGPQAGIIAGRKDLVDRCRHHPLMRALRPDKMTLAALTATLQVWRDQPHNNPVYKMLNADIKQLKKRAEDLAAQVQQDLKKRADDDNIKIDCTAASCIDRVGGGSSPLLQLEGWALRISGPGITHVQTSLRDAQPPLISRIIDESLRISLRTIQPKQDPLVYEAIVTALKKNIQS